MERTSAAGDLIACSGILTSDGNANVTVQVGFTGGTPATAKPVSVLSQAINHGRWYQELVVPAGTTDITVLLTVSASTSVTDFAQLTVYNLTRQGIVTV